MESLIVSPTTPSSNGIASDTFATIDPAVVVDHLAAVLEITLGATRRQLEDFGSLLSKAKYSETVQRCTRFATESQAQVLYVRKDVVSVAEDHSNGIVDASGEPQRRLKYVIC
jgi:dynein heavy chain 1